MAKNINLGNTNENNDLIEWPKSLFFIKKKLN